MTLPHRRAWMLTIALAVPTAFTGCETAPSTPPAANPAETPHKDVAKQPVAEAAEPGGGAMGGPRPGGMGGPPPSMGGPATGIKAVMRKTAMGPNSLTNKLGSELKAEAPEWETIQAHTKEYVALAKELATYDPPKGTKESWQKLTAEFTTHAEEMDKAAQAKDKDATGKAQALLAGSCKSCHGAHQPQRGGPGGGFGRGFGGLGGPGGPPQGGPGGEPPK